MRVTLSGIVTAVRLTQLSNARDVMLVFYGKNVPAEEAERLITDLQTRYKNLEIMLNNGAQPVYDYIFVLC
jgi:dihydroxyacetone kinase-like predicted kinase